MSSEDNIYRELQKHLDSGPAGFQASDTGADIKLLKHLLKPEEAKIATLLSTLVWEPVGTIHKRVTKEGVKITEDDLRKTLDEMVRKGTIVVHSQAFGERRYKNVGVSAGGMIDFQVNRLTPDFIEDLDKYHEESFAARTQEPAQPAKPPKKMVAQLRTIPVARSVELPEKNLVGVYDDVRALVEKQPGPFSVANCVCRQMKDLQGQPCQYSDIRETCIQVGPDHARQYIEMGIGREISRGEVFEVLDRAEQAGFILQPENSLSPENICCCCGDCCGPLSAAKKSPNPASFYTSNYYVTVNPELCKGCEVCIGRCQMEARKMVDGVAIVEQERCIGCGNCVVTCETGASIIQLKEETQVPFRDKDDTFMNIMANKLGTWGMLKLRLKMMLGMKV
ncbi:MAG: 4Fe-4S binding protein [Dehalococcoidales bacterium]|nr:4Fe-4S binding protein [Dehalococcoidales bacterium]